MQELQTHLENISFGHNDTLRKKTWKAIRGLQEEEDIIKLFTVLHQEYSTLDTHINMYVENGMNRLSKVIESTSIVGLLQWSKLYCSN